MRSSLHERPFDVVIVDATGGTGDPGFRLCAELQRRGIRVQLDRIPAPSKGDLPPLTGARVSQSRYCMLLLGVEEETAFLAFEAARRSGEPFELGIARAEIGRVGKDVTGLVDRVAGWLSATDRSSN